MLTRQHELVPPDCWIHWLCESVAKKGQTNKKVPIYQCLSFTLLVEVGLLNPDDEH